MIYAGTGALPPKGEASAAGRVSRLILFSCGPVLPRLSAFRLRPRPGSAPVFRTSHELSGSSRPAAACQLGGPLGIKPSTNVCVLPRSLGCSLN